MEPDLSPLTEDFYRRKVGQIQERLYENRVDGLLLLDSLANGVNRASAISRDGQVIGGFAQGSFNRTPARWSTDGSGSIFGRFTDVDLGTYPELAWSWLVKKPVDSPLDERTVEGDDHPARLYLRFETGDGSDHSIEIIWANKLFEPGDYDARDPVFRRDYCRVISTASLRTTPSRFAFESTIKFCQ